MSVEFRVPSAGEAAPPAAGTVLPPGASGHPGADVLTARTYTHPALDGRPVVRLVPGALGEAEDLAMEFLGLERQPGTPEVGTVRREALGFPARALVDDPANGHHALAVVKDVERLARQAKGLPGVAKGGFEHLGERLARSVPRFLPPFYEQAARIYLEHGHRAFAATFFARAREAERVHALTVDEEQQRAAFLEFAFAGALSVKALREYAGDVARRLDPAAAWEQFRRLLVERCAAGLPPYTATARDVRAVIRASGLPRTAEECRLLAAVVASPAAERASGAFWKAFLPSLKVLAAEQPRVRVSLLEIMPRALGLGAQDDEFWLSLLAGTGADRLLMGEDEGSGEVDAADWLTRWARHRKNRGFAPGRCPDTLALAARMAPWLRSGGRTVDLFTGRRELGADLDLLDLCLAEGVPLAVPGPDADVRLSLERRLKDARPGARDLAAVAADPRTRPLLRRAVGAVARLRPGAATLEAMAGHPVVSGVLREWLEEAAGTFAAATGPTAARVVVDRLRAFAPVAERVAPGVSARIARRPVAPLLGHALRTGLLDELWWPALEEALDLLEEEPPHPRRGNRLLVREAWPALILSRGERVLVVGPQRVLLDHTLRLPDGPDRWEAPRFRFADGELLVMWSQAGKRHAYWSSRPSDVFLLGGAADDVPLPHDPAGGPAEIGAPSFQLPGGGRATGGPPLCAGATVLPPSRPLLGDGTALWMLVQDGGERARLQEDEKRTWLQDGEERTWREYDPASGGPGPASLPGFLRAGVREAARLLPGHCEVLPVRPGLEDSPLGTDGTVLGRWVRDEGDGRLSAGSPDGRVLTVPGGGPEDGVCPLGFLRLPGGADLAAVRRHGTVAFFAPDDLSEGGELGRVTVGEQDFGGDGGVRLVPPPAFWHALRPRDDGSSAVLRALTDGQAQELLDAAGRALAEYREADRAGGAAAASQDAPGPDEVVRRAVAATLPALTCTRLLAGVAAVVRETLRIAERTAAFGRVATHRNAAPAPNGRRGEDTSAGHRPPHGDDLTLEAALAGIAHRGGHPGSPDASSTLRQVLAVNHVLSGRPADGRPLIGRERIAAPYDGWVTDERTVPAAALPWPRMLPLLRALLRRAASPFLPEAHREALRLFLAALAAGPLTDGAGALRTVVLSEPSDQQQRTGQVLRKDGRTVVLLGRRQVDGRRGRHSWVALDHDPSGGFAPVARFTAERETRIVPGLDRGRLTEVVRRLEEQGAAPWRPEAPAALAAATGGGLGPLQAAMLLAGAGLGGPASPDGPSPAGVAPRQRDLARNLLRALPEEDRLAVAGALLPDDPAGLWTSGPDVAAAGRVWEERLGGLVRLPEELAPTCRTPRPRRRRRSSIRPAPLGSGRRPGRRPPGPTGTG